MNYPVFQKGDWRTGVMCGPLRIVNFNTAVSRLALFSVASNFPNAHLTFLFGFYGSLLSAALPGPPLTWGPGLRAENASAFGSRGTAPSGRIRDLALYLG